MPGYSATPLIKKLGLKSGDRFFVKNCPISYQSLLGHIPDLCRQKQRLCRNLDYIHFFTTSLHALEQFIPKAIANLHPNGMIWVSWPKKASKVATDVTEDRIRHLALQTVLVDVKVCAVNEIWSGLKLVIRSQHRQ